MSKASYQEYLQTDHWKSLRTRKWNKQNPHCAICGAKDVPLDTHHLEYKKLYDVTPDLLRLLCRTCHYRAHDLWPRLRFYKPSHHSRFQTLRNAVRRSLGLGPTLEELALKKKERKERRERRRMRKQARIDSFTSEAE